MALNTNELNAIKLMLIDYSKLIESNTAQGTNAWNYAEKVSKEIELVQEISNNNAWANYKLMLSNGEIDADTYALLTADLPAKGSK